MARTHFVKKARKDYPEAGIKKGESYYWWKFRYGGKHMSKEAPKASQLTQSEFLSSLYDIQERLAEITGDDITNLQGDVQSISEELNQMAEECREKHDNMPEGLQEGEVGQMLEERADACENAASELDGIDFDINDDQTFYDEVKEELEDDLELDSEVEADIIQDLTDDGELTPTMTEEDRKKAISEELEFRKQQNEQKKSELEEEIQEKVQEKKQERIDEIIEEIQNVSIDCQ
jgi:hypothetical protein